MSKNTCPEMHNHVGNVERCLPGAALLWGPRLLVSSQTLGKRSHFSTSKLTFPPGIALEHTVSGYWLCVITHRSLGFECEQKKTPTFCACFHGPFHGRPWTPPWTRHGDFQGRVDSFHGRVHRAPWMCRWMCPWTSFHGSVHGHVHGNVCEPAWKFTP